MDDNDRALGLLPDFVSLQNSSSVSWNSRDFHTIVGIKLG